MFQLKFAGITLDDCALWEEDTPMRVAGETFPRKHGSIAQKLAFMGPRIVTVSGEVVKETEAALKSYINTLYATLVDRGRDRLYRLDDNRYLNAIATGFRHSFQAARTPAVAAHFSIQFLADDPFWYDGQTHSIDPLQSVSSSPHTFSVTNNGATKTPPLVEIKAVGGDKTDVKLTNGTIGLSVRYAGTILSGQTLSIDFADFKVNNGGVNGLKDFSGTFWNLEPGAQNLTYEGPTSVTINVVWLERWI